MVRYSEIINENVDVRKIEQLLSKFVNIKYLRSKVIDPNTGKVEISADYVTVTTSINGKLPVQFSTIHCDFFCDNINLTTLEGAPIFVAGAFSCSGNPSLKSLKYTPKTVDEVFSCYNTGITSLEGIDLSSKIDAMFLPYREDLPLLRALITKEVTFYDDEGNNRIYNDLADIINEHITQYANIKERLIKCQYAMIKAGYKGNAKW